MYAIKNILTTLLVLFICVAASGQFSEKKLKDKANLYFKNEKYFEALQLYQKYDKIKNNNEDVKLRLGICYYFNNDVTKSIDYLSSLVYNQSKPSSAAYFYLGAAYHSNQEFKKAITNYKLFLKNSPSNNPNRRAIKDEIKRCAYASKISHQPKLAVVENLGENVNTVGDDFAPVQSPNVQKKLYFSSSRKGNLGGLRDKKGELDDLRGKYSSDVFSVIIQNGEWTNPKRLNNLINSPQNDVALDFNESGTAMLLFKGFDLFSGQILIDSFQPIEEKPLFPPQFKAPIVAERGDGFPCFFNDSTIVFSSRITGGYGGSDLYITQFSNGKWSSPQNLGETINTPYDETTPYLANDGRTLYYSSNTTDGIGGFDIYKTIFNDFKKIWAKPLNLGIPINSPKDDDFFRLNNDGTQGYFSSSRKEGYGERDIYVAYFKTQNMEQLVISNPTSFHTIAFGGKNNDSFVPTGEEVAFQGEKLIFEVSPIYYEKEKDVLSPTNISELNKVVKLLAEYPQLKIELIGNSDNEDQAQFSLYFSIKRSEQVANYLIKSGVEPSNIIVKGCGANFPIATNAFGGAPNLLGQRMNRRIDIKIFNTQRMPVNVISKKPKIEKAMIASKGIFYNKSIKGLSYKVQVAEIKQNYNSDLITKYPDATVESKADSPYYNYTVGLYQTFDSAEALRKELQRQGITIAEVIPYLDGIRISEDESKAQSVYFPDLLNFIDSASQH